MTPVLKSAVKVAAKPVDMDQVRTAVRFPMELPLVIRTPEGEIRARTENISANGILFSGAMLPAVESRIEFTINMPAAVMGSPTDVLIECVGRIVRREKRDGMERAAAIIDEYFLRV